MNIKYFRTQEIHKVFSWVGDSTFVETKCGHFLPAKKVERTTKTITCKRCLGIDKKV